MIEIITGIIGFVAGIITTLLIFRYRKNQHWGKGYLLIKNSSLKQQDQQSKQEQQLPDWF